MGATTTQGTGPGSAEGLTKGPGNNRNTYVPLLGPRVVASGSVETDGSTPGAATVTFENAIEEGYANFIVLLSGVGTNANIGGTSGSATTFTGFSVRSEVPSSVVYWTVVRIGVQ